MRNSHLRLKPTPWIASDWGKGDSEGRVLSARIRALNLGGRRLAGPIFLALYNPERSGKAANAALTRLRNPRRLIIAEGMKAQPRG